MLHFEVIEPTPNGDASSRGTLLFLHGILGQGVNWRTVARRVSEETGLSAALVDLRHHGDSTELNHPGEFAAPNTVEACARDLLELPLSAPIVAVLGHSFGGKVALAFKGLATAPHQTFVVDSCPGPRPDKRGSEGVLNVLEQLKTVLNDHDLEGKRRFDSRREFIGALASRGITKSTATWLAMNLIDAPEAPGDMIFGVDLRRIDELLGDYFEADLWEQVDDTTALLIGERSTIVDDETIQGAKSRGAAIATFAAGHWVHVEATDALVDDLSARLRDLASSSV